MNPSKSPKVKICCISSIKEAEIAIKCGANAIGLVGPMPSGPGIIDDELIKEIAQIYNPSITTFLLTSETNADNIINHHNKVKTKTIQMVDALTDCGYEQIRKELPGVKLVQVIHVLDESSIKEAKMVSKYVDYVLLDSGNPNLDVKLLGGTGRTHNWLLSQQIRQQIDIPVFLAGGIGIDNVQKAIKTVQPYGIDLCSSVRTNGKLDKSKLEKFFRAIREPIFN